jgi:DNA polymerase-3 subunit beta
MNGVLIQLKDNELRLVTTDGARLALNKRKMEGKVADGELIVGTKVFDLLDMGKEENLEIFTEERMVGLKSADTTIIARLIEGPYPNYEGVIPLSFKGNCSIEKDILDGALKRVSLVAPPYVKNVKFDFREHGILLSSSSPDVGEAKEEVPCVYDGEKMGIWFNASFVLEILRHITSESIKLNLTSSNTAALLKSEAQENLLYLLMPLRIDNWE